MKFLKTLYLYRPIVVARHLATICWFSVLKNISKHYTASLPGFAATAELVSDNKCGLYNKGSLLVWGLPCVVSVLHQDVLVANDCTSTMSLMCVCVWPWWGGRQAMAHLLAGWAASLAGRARGCLWIIKTPACLPACLSVWLTDVEIHNSARRSLTALL